MAGTACAAQKQPLYTVTSAEPPLSGAETYLDTEAGYVSRYGLAERQGIALVLIAVGILGLVWRHSNWSPSLDPDHHAAYLMRQRIDQRCEHNLPAENEERRPV